MAWIAQFSLEAVASKPFRKFLHFVEVGMPDGEFQRQVFEDPLPFVSTGKYPRSRLAPSYPSPGSSRAIKSTGAP